MTRVPPGWQPPLLNRGSLRWVGGSQASAGARGMQAAGLQMASAAPPDTSWVILLLNQLNQFTVGSLSQPSAPVSPSQGHPVGDIQGCARPGCPIRHCDRGLDSPECISGRETEAGGGSVEGGETSGLHTLQTRANSCSVTSIGTERRDACRRGQNLRWLRSSWGTRWVQWWQR